MKARKYDRKILQKGIVPNVYAIQESGNITDSIIEFIQKHDEKIVNDVIYLKEIFESGKEFGSLIQVKNIDFNNLRTSLSEIIDNSKSTLTDINITNIISNDLMTLINQAELLSKKYSAVVTNPPYMNKFEKNLKDFAKKYYKDYSKDLFSMFIYRNFDFCNKYGYNALMTPLVWMFIKNYEDLRKFILNNKSICSLIQFEYSAFSEATVPICTFILSNNPFEDYNGIYFKLSEFIGGMEIQKNKFLEAVNTQSDYKYYSNNSFFKAIPGIPLSYWTDKNLINAFANGVKLENISDLKIGLQTGDNDYFLRFWYEVNKNHIGFNLKPTHDFQNSDLKWIPHNKGGPYRKWYGNQDYIVKWENNGYELKNFKKSVIRNSSFYFKECISWSTVTSSIVSYRYFPEGFTFNNASAAIFIPKEKQNYVLGFLNSNIVQEILDILVPTVFKSVGYVSLIPILFSDSEQKNIENIVTNNIKISKKDWNDYELSWEFLSHPFLRFYESTLKNSFDLWEDYKNKQFNLLKDNEIKLNQTFSKIYKLNMDCNVNDKHISISKANYETDIKSFISYAVGCMFGRYSLDNEGLQFAGGVFNINNYNKFKPDDDNIIPVLDTAYFDDDIVGYFTKFVETCFGKKTLEENLDFIAGALSKSKKPSREIIRQYLLKNFFNDHKKTYKKCPIYWQFSSGKHNGFNCLVYMHRYEPSLVARIRTDYLHKTQKAIEQRIVNNDNIINNSTSKQEVTRATKEKAKLQKQLKETQEYDKVLAHIANQNIKIDLDDGVKVNYAKFQNIEIKKEGSKTKKVNLLKKI